MASKITQYKVFIASPGGLEKEREAFRAALSGHNEADGLARGAYFSPVGWELTIRGVGRPQAKINDDVKKSDFFVLVLWDRWGSPPDNAGKYTSGTEEEYKIALECFSSRTHPLREILVFFKTVDPRQLSDPGAQLKQVLDYKKKLEAEKKIFFETFDDIEVFSEKLRRYLASWTRDHESGKRSKLPVKPLVTPVVAKYDPVLEDVDSAVKTGLPNANNFVDEVEILLKQGKLTDAEAKLAAAIMSGDNMTAFRTYGGFLVKQNRLTDAESVFKKMLGIAKDADEFSWAGSALAGLGGIYRMRGDFLRSFTALKDALVLKEKAKDESGMTYISIWLGDLCFKFEKWTKADEYFRKALQLCDSIDNEHLKADILAKLAKSSLKTGNVPEAVSFEDQARNLFKKLGDADALARMTNWRKGSLNKAVHLAKLPRIRV